MVCSDIHESSRVLCPDCGLLSRRVPLPPGGRARCGRCRAVLYREAGLRLDVLLALSLAGVVMFLPANLFSMVSMHASGTRTSTTLLYTALAMWRQGMQPVALLIFFTAILTPALELGILCYLTLLLSWRRSPPGFVSLMRLLVWIKPWGMAEVFLIGVLVALVKLARLAEVEPGFGLWSFSALIVLLALCAGVFDSRGLWWHYRRVRGE